MINYIEFLKVANLQKTGLGTNKDAADYIRDNNGNYKDLKIEISYGIGLSSGIPWIAFLGYNQKVQNGIYPVLLYYKDFDLLILCYGVSENNEPEIKWDLPANTKSVRQYFKENNLKHPRKYGNSLVYKVYDPGKISNNAIVKDLENLIKEFKRTMEQDSNSQVKKQVRTAEGKNAFNIKEIEKSIFNSNLVITDFTLTRFVASLLTKPFVILTGLSGSGKTKLAQAFAMWICEKPNQYCIVPVGADWTNREPLLGFPNALQEKEYVKPDNRVLDLIIDANDNPDKPYFLILDEMNLSHVERYFADFLSVMESKSKISLHPGIDNWNDVPAEIGFPKNLFTIGTVNIDETTYMFSPKVLDRANVIEFRVTEIEMENYLKSNAIIDLESLEGLGANMAGNFVQLSKDSTLKSENIDDLNKALLNFFIELKKAGTEFGYRSASEILRFAAVVNKIAPGWELKDIADAAIMQKLLPKLHGSRTKLMPVMISLGKLCLKDALITYNSTDKDKQFTKDCFESTPSIEIIYPISFEKINRMYRNLISNGFTSYAEA